MKRLCIALMLAMSIQPAYAAMSLVYDLPLENSTMPFIGRDIWQGQYKAGAAYIPIGMRNKTRKGVDTELFRLGLYVNAQNRQATFDEAHFGFGPMIAVNALALLAHIADLDHALNLSIYYKPLGLAQMSLMTTAFIGVAPFHDKSVNGPFQGGFGLLLKAKFGEDPYVTANSIAYPGL